MVLILTAITMAVLTRLPWLGIAWLAVLGCSLFFDTALIRWRGQDSKWGIVCGWFPTVLATLSLLATSRKFTLFDTYYSVLCWLLAFALALTIPRTANLAVRRHSKVLAMVWAFYGGFLWLGTAYQQNWSGVFYTGLLINLGLAIVCRLWFRLGPFGIQLANTLILLLGLLPLLDRLARPAEYREGNTEVAGNDYVFAVLKKDPKAFRRWWFRLCGQLDVLGQDVFMPDPKHGLPFRLRPGSAGSFFQSRIVINSRGFRGKEFAADKGDAYRIVALGESTTFGLTLTPEHRPWPELLEEMIQDRLKPARPVEVINAGIPKFTLEQNIQRLPEEILTLKPDMIISYHGFNGFQLLSDVLPPIFGKPLPVFKARPLRLLAVLEFKLKMFHYTRRQNTKVVPQLPAAAELLKTKYARAYQQLITAAETNHIRLVLANYSMSVNGASDADVVEFYRAAFPAIYWQIKANQMHSILVEALARQHPEISFANTHPHLDGDYDKFVDPMHFTPDGDRQMAETFFEGIRKLLEQDLSLQGGTNSTR